MPLRTGLAPNVSRQPDDERRAEAGVRARLGPLRPFTPLFVIPNQPMGKASAKFVRPETPSPGVTTERDLDIIEAILRYRFSPTSQLVRLVGGNEDVTLRRLRRLWEKGFVNRWAFPGIRTHSEFHYYLDSREPVDLLMAHGRITEPNPAMLEEIRSNREKDYADAAVRGQHMQLGFLQHSLMISRMHFMLEMACRRSSGSAKLDSVVARWLAGR